MITLHKLDVFANHTPFVKLMAKKLWPNHFFAKIFNILISKTRRHIVFGKLLYDKETRCASFWYKEFMEAY